MRALLVRKEVEMGTVILIILLIISVIMTGLILIQHSEGGALGIGGGGGGGGGFMSGRSAASSVSRMTWILGSVFLAVSLALSVIMTKEAVQRDLVQEVEEVQVDNSQENSAPSLGETLTDQSDSGETTDPLADSNNEVEAGANPEDTPEETPAEPAETPDDE